jgi:hypothetical protein
MNVSGTTSTERARNTSYLARPEGRIAYDIAGDAPLVVLVPVVPMAMRKLQAMSSP